MDKIVNGEKERIRKWKESHPEWSSRRIADKFGVRGLAVMVQAFRTRLCEG